jgi:YVTN family beta-propeller protein
MQSENSKRNYARRMQAFAALWAALAMTCVSALPAKAELFFVYVADGRDDVTVIDTASNSVVATIPWQVTRSWLLSPRTENRSG